MNAVEYEAAQKRVKTAPERFEPRSITTEALDGVNVVVTSGLKAEDRIATQGATLINQVR